VGHGIAVDSSGNAYVTGGTTSTNFPTAFPLQASLAGSENAFVAKLNAAGSDLVYSTYLGGSGSDYGTGIAVDSSGNASVAGVTSSKDFPTVNPLQARLASRLSNGFVAKISPLPAPVVTLSPPSVAFGSQVVGTTSSAQSVTLTNSGPGSLTIASATVSADFALATTGTSCPYSGGAVAPGGTCTVDVTFTPTATGPLSGSVTIVDNDHGIASSTQTVSLSGTGADFTLAVASGYSSSQSVSPGQTATYTLSVGGEGGFNQAVTFTCAGAPSESTCTVSPNPATVGSSATSVTVTVTTTASSASAPRTFPPLQPRLPRPQVMLMLAALLAAGAWLIRDWREEGASRGRAVLLPLAAGLLLAVMATTCGGGGGGGGGSTNPGTPAGSYALTVTGTFGSGSTALSHSIALTLSVS
jgi:VCBS repeat-containing protein